LAVQFIDALLFNVNNTGTVRITSDCGTFA